LWAFEDLSAAIIEEVRGEDWWGYVVVGAQEQAT
jgi:hypothetical protein